MESSPKDANSRHSSECDFAINKINVQSGCHEKEILPFARSPAYPTRFAPKNKSVRDIKNALLGRIARRAWVLVLLAVREKVWIPELWMKIGVPKSLCKTFGSKRMRRQCAIGVYHASMCSSNFELQSPVQSLPRNRSQPLRETDSAVCHLKISL